MFLSITGLVVTIVVVVVEMMVVVEGMVVVVVVVWWSCHSASYSVTIVVLVMGDGGRGGGGYGSGCGGVENTNSHVMSFSLPGLVMTIVEVILHREMSLNLPDGHFHLFIFSESKFYAISNSENHFQIRGLVAELHVLEYSRTTFCTFEKALSVEDSYVETIGWDLKIMFLTMKHGKVGYFHVTD